MNITLNGNKATAADVRQLREEVVPIRNKMLGPEIFDGRGSVVLSHVIAVLGDLAVAMDEEERT